MVAATSLPYARRAMNHTKTAWVNIKIDIMTHDDAVFWDEWIQPMIQGEALLAEAHGEATPRADRYWKWPDIRNLLPLTQLMQRRRCQALTIFVENIDGSPVPAGMLLLIERYPWPIANASITHSTFTWFLSSAPIAALKALAVADPPSLGRILIDTALITSKSLGSDGQMWLHAAPSGGFKLAAFYSRICGMSALPVGTPIPLGRRSDGRHFFATSDLADELIEELKHTR